MPLFGQRPVGLSADLERVLRIPRRPRPTLEEQERAAAAMTERLRRRGEYTCRCAELRPGARNPCITRLLPIQGWYLQELAQRRGAAGFIAVGGGKTGIDILAAMVVPGVRKAVLLVPPALRAQLAADLEIWAQHFEVPNTDARPYANDGRAHLTVVAYSEISSQSKARWLAAVKPDLIIADEMHSLKRRSAARTGRFLRFLSSDDAPDDACFVGHSGSATTKSISDYGHLLALALGEGAPVPLDAGVLGEWAAALDAATAGRPRAHPGALRSLCRPGEPTREGYRRRLVETAGVITTTDVDLPCELVLATRKPPPIPPRVAEALAHARKGTRPDWLVDPRFRVGEGEELTDAMTVALVSRQIATGFMYRWRYPNGEPEELILEWFRRRQAWNREVRQALENPRDGLDTEGLLRAAGVRYLERYSGDDLPVFRTTTLRPWLEIAGKVRPVVSTAWIDRWLVDDAVAWARESTGVVWYAHTAFGIEVERVGRLARYGEGKEASAAIQREDGSRSIVASIKTHGTGKNLQAWSRALVTTPPSDSGAWEQLLGRHHRQGQEADEVRFDVYLHTPEFAGAIDAASEGARYVQQTTGAVQRLALARRVL